MNFFNSELCLKASLLALSCAISTAVKSENLAPAVLNSQSDINDIPVESISVTGSRTNTDTRLVAGAIAVIDEEQIRSSGAVSISDILRTIPSVNISQSGPIGALTEIRFRGSESNHVLVMVDGVEINDLAQGGLIDLAHISLENVYRIEVLRGPQSALWGSNAVSGVISITSKAHAFSNEKDALSGNIGISYGTKQTQQLRGSLAKGIGKLRFSINASYFDTDGENTSLKSTQQDGDASSNESDGYTNTSVNGALAYAFSEHNQLKANARIVKYSSDFDAVDFSTGLLTDADNRTDAEQLSFGFDWYFSPGKGFWSQQLSYQFNNNDNQSFSDASSNELRALSGASEGQKQRLVYNHNFQLSRGHLNLGLENVQEDFEQKGPVVFGDPNQQQSNSSTSLISDGQYSLSKDWSLSASYRFDRNSAFKNAESFRMGSRFILTNSVSAFVSYAKAVKNPSFTERFGFFPGTFLGNNDLIPESSKSFEVGTSAAWRDYQLQLSWYQAKLKNEILGFVFDSASGLFTAQNASTDSDREGFELELSAEYGNLQWAFTYAYLDANENGEAELRRAKHSGSGTIRYQISDKQSLYLQSDYTGSRDDLFFPPFPQASQRVSLGNYWLVSANYLYRYSEALDVSLRVSNAFDEKYQGVFSYSGESRRILASLNYRW